MRTAVITFRLLPLVISLLRDQRRWIAWGAPLRRTADSHRRRAEALVHALAVLGPTFVKLAQVFASRADVVPEPYLSALGTLTDQVPPIPWAQVERVIEASYGAPVAEIFQEIDQVPLAAASLGQVHRARHAGAEVVVKVLRPGVERLVAADIAAATRILRVVHRLWPNRHVVALQAVIGEFSLRIWDEMDFRKEGAFAAEVRANFAGHRGVRVPAVVADLTRQHVLVLEYIEGRRVDRLEEWVAQGRIRPTALLRTVIEAYLQMMLVDGLFHADPHPGNLLVDAEGRLVILDFGMVVRVPRELRLDLVRTVFASIRRDPAAIVRGFRKLGIILPEADDASIEALVTQLLVLATMHATTEERIQHILADEVMQAMFEAPVQLPSDLVYFARTASLIEGLGFRYDTHFNAVDFATPIALRLRGPIMRSLGAAEVMQAIDWPSRIGSFLGGVARVMDQAGREIGALVAERLLLPAARN
jgi:predicted unusual protein kinase regulating ubiquinone biosynthesis (AarF/ABC1/UbiB family)